jgi:Na+/melibiose symporter-like transporter
VSVRRLVIADALTTVGVGTSTSLFMFFWRSRGVTGAETSLLVLTYLAATLATVPVWMAIAKRIGKHRALIASCTGFIIVIPGMGILPANRLEILLPAIALLGMTFSGQFLIRAMAADAADAARLQTGVDRLGQVYALLSSTAKLGPALAVGMAYAILDRVGFKAAEGAANSSTAIHTLALLYLGFPAVMMMFGALAFLGYKLDKAEHARVAAALDERDQVTTHPS